MTREQVEEIKRRAEEATPGPWVVDTYQEGNEYVRAGNDLAANAEGASAEFIAHARADVPALIAALEEAWARIEEGKEKCFWLRDERDALKAEVERLNGILDRLDNHFEGRDQ